MSYRFATNAVHAGLEPEPTLRRRRAADPPGLDVRAEGRRRLRRGLRLLALGEPDARRAGAGDRGARGRLRVVLLLRHGGRARADHGGVLRRRSRRDPGRPVRRHLPARRQGAQALGPGRTRWSTRPTSTRSPRRSRPETKLVWIETPTNPTLKVIDVAGVIERSGGAFVAVDNTFATPVYQRPLELGADAVVHSATKYLGGHSDSVSGAVVVKDEAAHAGGAVRAELRRRGARPAGLLPRAPRAADAAPADGGAHRERARGLGVARGRGRRVRRALARVLRDGLVPAPGRGRRWSRARRCSRWPSRSAAWSR